MKLSKDARDAFGVLGVISALCLVTVLAVHCATPTRAATCVPEPTYSPTPTLLWSQVDSDVLAGYTLYYRENGGPLVTLGDLLCEWEILDDEGLFMLRHCRGAEFDIPVQRYCATCVPLREYEFTVKALDLFGQRSVDYATPVAICMPLMRDFTAP